MRGESHLVTKCVTYFNLLSIFCTVTFRSAVVSKLVGPVSEKLATQTYSPACRGRRGSNDIVTLYVLPYISFVTAMSVSFTTSEPL